MKPTEKYRITDIPERCIMKKEDLKLHELPESYAADSKYCRLRKSEDFEIGLFSWTEEDEAADDFYTEEFQIADFFSNYLACLDNCDEPVWFKIETEAFLNAINKLDEDEDCKIIYCLWHDGSRQNEYFLKPVAHNNKWTYFELGENRW